jgi:hypothetical protein
VFLLDNFGLLCRTSKNRLLFKSAVLAACSDLVGCASSVSISTEPVDAEIYVSSPGQATLNKLNNSPVTLTDSDLSKYADAGLTTFYVRKKGFGETQVIVPNLTGKLELKIRLKSSVESAVDTTAGSDTNVNAIVEKVQDADRFLRTGADQEAVKIADQLIEKNKDIAVAYVIKAYVMNKKNNKSEALSLLQKSQEIYPNKAVGDLVEKFKKELSGAAK